MKTTRVVLFSYFQINRYTTYINLLKNRADSIDDEMAFCSSNNANCLPGRAKSFLLNTTIIESASESGQQSESTVFDEERGVVFRYNREGEFSRKALYSSECSRIGEEMDIKRFSYETAVGNSLKSTILGD